MAPSNPLLTIPPNPQTFSPLFNRIPPEIRHQIFTLALASFPDPIPVSHYETATCYTRPSYFAPYKSDIRLLRTCRAVYSEAWWLPFLLREQIHWLTTEDRAPPEYRGGGTERWELMERLERMEEFQGEKVEIESLRVFAQMWALESLELSDLLGTEGLNPRTITLTIRHADWWWWENDRPLYIESSWVKDAWRYLSSSVREVRIELESLERKKDQVDRIAKQMTERWYFTRKDNVSLFPNVTEKAMTVDRWKGTSRWNGKTWTRDESRPGEIDYYMVTIVFRPEWVVKRCGGQVSRELVEKAKTGQWDSSTLFGVSQDSQSGSLDTDESESDHTDWEDTMEIEWEDEDNDGSGEEDL